MSTRIVRIDSDAVNVHAVKKSLKRALVSDEIISKLEECGYKVKKRRLLWTASLLIDWSGKADE